MGDEDAAALALMVGLTDHCEASGPSLILIFFEFIPLLLLGIILLGGLLLAKLKVTQFFRQDPCARKELKCAGVDSLKPF